MKTKYKNPRLKHVKNIDAISSALLNYHDLDDVVKDFLKTISDQCNLLLETKKRKKCEVGFKVYCGVCGCWVNDEPKHKHTIPSPQPEIEKVSIDLQSNDFTNLLEVASALNEVIGRLNKITKTK